MSTATKIMIVAAAAMAAVSIVAMVETMFGIKIDDFGLSITVSAIRFAIYLGAYSFIMWVEKQ